MTRVSNGHETRSPPASELAGGLVTPLAHPRPGYPLSGCSPAEPDSVSPGNGSVTSPMVADKHHWTPEPCLQNASFHSELVRLTQTGLRGSIGLRPKAGPSGNVPQGRSASRRTRAAERPDRAFPRSALSITNIYARTCWEVHRCILIGVAELRSRLVRPGLVEGDPWQSTGRRKGGAQDGWRLRLVRPGWHRRTWHGGVSDGAFGVGCESLGGTTIR